MINHLRPRARGHGDSLFHRWSRRRRLFRARNESEGANRQGANRPDAIMEAGTDHGTSRKRSGRTTTTQFT
jgi:hypothetical protein